MANSVMQQRFGSLFDAWDANHDGYIAADDVAAYAHKLAEMRGYAKDAPAVQNLVDELGSEWQQMSGAADSDHDGRIERAEFVAFAEGMSAMLGQLAAAGQPWPFDSWVDGLFGVLDADKDGRITPEEYHQVMTAIGVADKMDVESVFKGFDKSQDGYLSRDEFAQVSRQFWLNADPNTPGHHLLGA